MIAKKEYERWLQHPCLDQEHKEILEKMEEATIQDSFYTQLTFGTAGIRGLLGLGPNRMNVYTLRKVNQGVVQHLFHTRSGTKKKSIVIGYDNRPMSYTFALDSARLFAMHGVCTYLFDTSCPTSLLAFAVCHYHCLGGIMITASHNSKEYNGYKLYDDKGCQVMPSLVKKVEKYMKAVEDELAIQVQPTEEQLANIVYIGQEVKEAYYKKVLDIQFSKKEERACKVVFSSRHGSGAPVIPEVLQRAGYEVTLVEEQCYPNSDLTNTLSWNLAEKETYTLAIEYAQKEKADVVLVSNSDASRVGLAVYHQKEYVILTGNQCGALLMEYVFSQMKKHRCTPEEAKMFYSIVTGNLGPLIAQSHGISCGQTLPGFRYIGDKIEKIEKERFYTYVFGYEESHGYLIKPFVRDRDAIQASLLLSEAVSYYKKQGKDLIDVLNGLYERHGFYLDIQTSMTFSGQEGIKKMDRLCKALRKKPFQQIGQYEIMQWEDYRYKKCFKEGREIIIANVPKDNVLKYYLMDGSWFAIRPSGTEEKCRFYYCITGKNEKEIQEKAKVLQKEVEQYFTDEV